jgi:pilus assembly protein CpaB
VKIEKMPADAFPKNGFSKVEDVLDRPVISNVLLDEPILEGRLAAKGSGLGLAPTIPVGMRAVTVRVNDVAGVAGFVLPGMKVDVLVTGHPPNGDGTMTTTCLQNMLVLSAGQTMTPDSRGQTIQAPTVTLLVDPEQAETLTLANSEGRIQLVLRNSSDQTIEKTTGRFVSELYGTQRKPVPTKPEAAPRPKRVVEVVAKAPPPPPVIAPAPPAPPDQIVVIRGTTRTVEVMPTRTNN